MALAPQVASFATTIIYVRDVAEAVDFYRRAFGLNAATAINDSTWAELATGSTTIGFTPIEQRETVLTGGVKVTEAGEPRGNVEISFSFADVDAAFKHAVAAGAVPVAEPEEKPWGQRMGYVRDINGAIIRIGSFTTATA